jgi:predicted dehydrogenase
MEEIKSSKVGFMGSGGIARSHAFSLNSLKYYYSGFPEIQLIAVSSATEAGRKSFAHEFGFKLALSPKDFFSNTEIDTVFILGPNNTHLEHLSNALKMRNIKKIYLEKPICSTIEEEEEIAKIAPDHQGIKIQVGFQFLFMSAIREALSIWKQGKLGKPLHFDFKYFHGDYLNKAYREKRTSRLTPAPGGGAMADLGSHVISLLLAFLGPDINVTGATSAGSFPDVDPLSDLFSLITLIDNKTGAAGTVSASRIASGTGDMLTLEIFAEKGAIRFSTYTPDFFEYYTEETGIWHRVITGSSYRNITTFPSGHVPAGWLRSMIHAHYVFLSGNEKEQFIPDLMHGLDVQRIIRRTAEILKDRKT